MPNPNDGEDVVSIPEMVRLIAVTGTVAAGATTGFNSRDGAIDRSNGWSKIIGLSEFQFQRWCD